MLRYSPEKYPLEVIHYKSAAFGLLQDSIDTQEDVTIDEVVEALRSCEHWDEFPPEIRPHYVAERILKKKREAVKAAVERENYRYNPDGTWQISPDSYLAEIIPIVVQTLDKEAPQA